MNEPKKRVAEGIVKTAIGLSLGVLVLQKVKLSFWDKLGIRVYCLIPYEIRKRLFNE